MGAPLRTHRGSCLFLRRFRFRVGGFTCVPIAFVTRLVALLLCPVLFITALTVLVVIHSPTRVLPFVPPLPHIYPRLELQLEQKGLLPSTLSRQPHLKLAPFT